MRKDAKDATTSGHTFVAHGRLESMITDAVIVPTDLNFNLEPYWVPLLGVDGQRLRPLTWPNQGWGRASGQTAAHTDIWFLDVDVTAEENPVDVLMRRLTNLLEAVHSSRATGAASTEKRGRVLPLIAMPLIGTRAGGLGSQTGTVVERLLLTARKFTDRNPVDVVIVGVRPAAVAALQQTRRRMDGFFEELPQKLLTTAQELGRKAAEGNLALLLGAGVSIPAGLPSWSGLIERLRTKARAIGASDGAVTGDRFDRLSALDQASLLEKILGKHFADDVVMAIGRPPAPALAHVLLAGLKCMEVVTTNYDDCYELAVNSQSPASDVRMPLGSSSTGTGRIPNIAVLPWEAPRPDKPWILKLHGDVHDRESIVLTRGQFVGYDSTWRPAGSLFQSVLLRRHLLVVGASLTDDNVLRLTHEVSAFRSKHKVASLLGVVLSLGPDPARARLWSDNLDWVGIDGGDQENQARILEVMLDAVAMYAARDHSYLLDLDFGGLLREKDRESVDDVRELAGNLMKKHQGEPQWESVLTALADWGFREAPE